MEIIELTSDKKPLVIVYTSDDVDPIGQQSKDLISQIVDHFNCSPRAEIYQTIHGHIVYLDVNEWRYPRPLREIPARLDLESFQFLQSVNHLGFRWIEAQMGHIKMGFTNAN